MSFRELFTRPPLAFLMAERGYEEADWVLLGVPLDITSTFRPGSRMGPTEIRRASLGLEIVALPGHLDTSALSIHDAGDLHVSGDPGETLDRLARVVAEVIADGKHLAVVGGEHTITLGVASGLRKATGELPRVVCLDAHLDMRDEFLGQRLCHATVCRRLVELLGPERLAIVGVRACSPEGLEFAERNDLLVITAQQAREEGPSGVLSALKSLLAQEGLLHISVDLDVLDPAFAPAVQTPEPYGLTPWELRELLLGLCEHGPVSVDLVELAPGYDHGQTALLAARLLADIMCAVGKRQA